MNKNIPDFIQAIHAAEYVKENPNTPKSTQLTIQFGHYPLFQQTLARKNPPSLSSQIKARFPQN